VVLFDYAPNYHRISDISDDVEVVIGDIGNPTEVIGAIQGNQVTDVFHAAASLSVAAERDIGGAYSTSIAGMFNLMESCRLLEIRKVIFLSSLSVFGSHTRLPFQFDSYRDPASFYGVGKVWGEVLGMYYHYHHQIDFRCVRFAVVIGPGRRGEGAAICFSTLVEKSALGRSAVVQVPDYTVLPIIYVDDAVDLLIALWKSDKIQQRLYIAGGVPVQVQDLISEVKKQLPSSNIKFEVDPVCEKVAETWTLLTTILVQQGHEEIYRDIKEIGWKLKHTTVQDITEAFVNDLQDRKDMYSAF
jgi:threonine 3-dehydrogenase